MSCIIQASTSNLSSTPTASVSKAESRDLLSRVTALQQDKWQLEEQVRHLEESAGAMANELLEKTKLLQDYIQHTRTGLEWIFCFGTVLLVEKTIVH